MPTLADLFADDSPPERVTPREKWTASARVVVLLWWHAAHDGYLSPEEADRVLAEAYLRPMPTITFAEICAKAWQVAKSWELDRPKSLPLLRQLG